MHDRRVKPVPLSSARVPSGAKIAVHRQEVDLRLVPLAFLVLIGLGTVLLTLPVTHRAGHSVGWLDALFLSVSATCVTGLTTINVAETFNGYG